MEKPYPGGEATTVDRLVRYLRENYEAEDGIPIEEDDLLRIVVRHKYMISLAIVNKLFANNPGDEIAKAEGLLPTTEPTTWDDPGTA